MVALVKLHHYHSRAICEAIKISLHDNFYRKAGWLLVMPSLQEQHPYAKGTDKMPQKSLNPLQGQ
jgi:hypothetical protein